MRVWYLTVIFLCTSQVANDVAHFFMYLFAILLGEMSFHVFYSCSNWIVCYFSLWAWRVFNIFYLIALYQIYVLQISPPGCTSFHFLKMVFSKVKLLILLCQTYQFFSFMDCTFGIRFKNICWTLEPKDFPHYSS